MIELLLKDIILGVYRLYTIFSPWVILVESVIIINDLLILRRIKEIEE